MARGASGMTALQLQGDGAAVEHERLATLADTQRRHIEELQAQLHEALAAKEALQLAAVERSPAPKSARALLSRAAADNTALARKVEALRAQRNALAVTKAALTMQLSELIRTAADDAQRAAQHEIHLARARAEACALRAELERLRSAAAGSPPGQPLDSAATSQLIWTGRRVAQEGTTPAASAAVPADPSSVSVSQYASARSQLTDVTQQYASARSQLTDVTQLSPLRGGRGSGVAAPDAGAGASATPGAGPLALQRACGGTVQAGSPLSSQSLSVFSASRTTPGSRTLGPRRLEMPSPTPTSKAVRPQREGDSGDGDCARDQAGQRASSVAPAPLQQQVQAQQQVQLPAAVLSGSAAAPSASATPAAAVTATVTPRSGHTHLLACPGTAGSAVGVCSRRQPALRLEDEFRLAACDSLWPTPALECEPPAADCREGVACAVRGLVGAHPLCALTLGSSCELTDAEGGDGEEGESGEARATGRTAGTRGHSVRWALLGLAATGCVIAPLTLAAAGGAAAGRLGSAAEVAQLLAAGRTAAGMTARRAARGATAGWRRCRRGVAVGWGRAAQHIAARRGACGGTGGDTSATESESPMSASEQARANGSVDAAAVRPTPAGVEEAPGAL